MDNDTKRKLAATQVVVKATHTENHFLWCLHAKDSPYVSTWKDPISKVEWIQDSKGFHDEIGKLADKPICITGFWSTVNGKIVLFVDMTSLYCDYSLLDPWIAENCPYAEEITDAMNFGTSVLY